MIKKAGSKNPHSMKIITKTVLVIQPSKHVVHVLDISNVHNLDYIKTL